MIGVRYTARQEDVAALDVSVVLGLMEKKVNAGCMGWGGTREQLLNVGQVMRYVIQEWATHYDEDRVLRMLMYQGSTWRKKPKIQDNDISVEIMVEDTETAKKIEELLKKDGYEEESF